MRKYVHQWWWRWCMKLRHEKERNMMRWMTGEIKHGVYNGKNNLQGSTHQSLFNSVWSWADSQWWPSNHRGVCLTLWQLGKYHEMMPVGHKLNICMMYYVHWPILCHVHMYVMLSFCHLCTVHILVCCNVACTAQYVHSHMYCDVPV